MLRNDTSITDAVWFNIPNYYALDVRANAEFVAYAVDNIHDIIIITSASSTATTCYSRTHARDSRPHRQAASLAYFLEQCRRRRALGVKAIRPGQGLQPHRPLSSATWNQVIRDWQSCDDSAFVRARALEWGVWARSHLHDQKIVQPQRRGLTHSVRSPGVVDDDESVFRAGHLPRLLCTPTKACLLGRARALGREGACAGRGLAPGLVDGGGLAGHAGECRGRGVDDTLM
ncbi:hypothetical protein F5X96DRAFT_688608 [Biscogniauxia mediterranea]|nr:hypothetical protein F5X96DRAFT_688608 [Biscogniauxia mediterranea]